MTSSFLQGAANILGMAIERQRYERSLHNALEHHKVLVNEINHRVKNSLQLVASMLSLQATATQDAALAQTLQEAVGRVTAVARIHERLYRTADIGTVDLAAYVGDICQDLAGLIPQCEVRYEANGPIPMATDRAVRVALLATELVTNSAKHAYPQGRQGPIEVKLSSISDDGVGLSVRDYGSGLPANVEVGASAGLGMKIIKALVLHMGASLNIVERQPGAEFVIEIPLQPEGARAES